MVTDTNTLAALIGSRICHDLISPIGAVSNGIELLELSGTSRSAELSLVAESVLHANARIRFFRLAFGVASPEQETGAEEVNSILKDLQADSRTLISEFPAGSHPRVEVRAALLALLCAEQAVPFGGRIAISRSDTAWTIHAAADRLNTDHTLWESLNGAPLPSLPSPSHVQFLILPGAAHDAKLLCAARITDTDASITLTCA